MSNPVQVTLLLPDREALALAQFVKRAYWNTWRDVAVDEDEAYLMRDAIDTLRKALAEAGFAPR